VKQLVGAPGFEPGASCAQGRRATRLRYAPTVKCTFILKDSPRLGYLHPHGFFSRIERRMRGLSVVKHNA
jgi:hypothetical protein